MSQSMEPERRPAEENLELLQHMSLFRTTTAEGVQALAAVATQVSAAANETLFLDGDPGDRVFFVCSGEVEIFLTNAAGTKITLETDEAGDFFGEVGALQGNRRTATACALRKTLALVVTGEDLKTVLRQYPDIMLAMYARTASRIIRTNVDLRRTTAVDAVQMFQEQMSEGEQRIGAIARFCGSLKMLGLNAVAVAAWLVLYFALGKNPFSGVAFNALTLALTLEAIAITCIVLHSQNAQEERERFIKETETRANIDTQLVVKTLDEKLYALRSELLARLPERPDAALSASPDPDVEIVP